MKYQLDTNFTKLNEKSGVLENQSTYATVEFSTSAQGVPPAGTGLYIAPGAKYRFSLTDSDGYVRFTAVRQGDTQREIAVVDNKLFSGAVGASGGASIKDWDTNTNYKKDDFVIYNNNLYRAMSDHASGSFVTDLNGGKWQMIGDLQTMQFSNLHTTNKTVIAAINELSTDKLSLTGGTMSGDIVQPATPTTAEHLTNKAYVDKAVADIVGGAPAGLDTLNKLAAALAADANLSTTLLNMIGQKLDTSEITTVATPNKVLRLDQNAELPANAQTASRFKNPIRVNGQQWFGDTDINISAAANIEDWQSGKSYTIGALVIYNDLLYQALNSHTASANFNDDMSVGFEKWKIIGGAGGTSSASCSQVTKLGVTATTAAPKIVELPVDYTTTFCLPPAEVLKFEQGLQNQVLTSCEFDNADADDFVIDGISGENAEYVEFDGTMHLKTKYDIQMNVPVALGGGYVSESEEIDFSQYKKVEAVE